MTVGQMIECLEKFDRALEVTISNGYDCEYYHTDRLKFNLYAGKYAVLDIGVGDSKIEGIKDDPSITKQF
jgi:hypothetical protein